MFGFFKSDPVKQLKKQVKKLYGEAMKVQRSGDLRLYAKKMEEVEALERKIQELTHHE